MPRGFYRLAKAEYTRLTEPDEDGRPREIPDAMVLADTGPMVYLHAARYPHKWLEAEVPKAKLKAMGETWAKMYKALPANARGLIFGKAGGKACVRHAFGARESVKAQAELDQDLGQ